MRLASTGREYARFTVSAPAALPLDVSVDGGLTWAAMERPSDTEARVLVAGPASLDNPAGTVMLAAGLNPVLVRLASTPEVVIRPAGVIHVYTP